MPRETRSQTARVARTALHYVATAGCERRAPTIRGDCRNFEPSVAVQPYVTTFLHPPEPYIFNIINMPR